MIDVSKLLKMKAQIKHFNPEKKLCLYVGRKEARELSELAKSLRSEFNQNEGVFREEFNGMPIYVVNEESHLNIG